MQSLLYNMPTLFAAFGIRLKQISRIGYWADYPTLKLGATVLYGTEYISDSSTDNR